jgi:hypothetical protein
MVDKESSTRKRLFVSQIALVIDAGCDQSAALAAV